MENDEKEEAVSISDSLKRIIRKSLIDSIGVMGRQPKSKLHEYLIQEEGNCAQADQVRHQAWSRPRNATSSTYQEQTLMGAPSSNAGTCSGAGFVDYQLQPGAALIASETINCRFGHICSMASGFNWVLFYEYNSNQVQVWRNRQPFAYIEYSKSMGIVNAIAMQDPRARIFFAHIDGLITVWESDIMRQDVYKHVATLSKPTLTNFLKNKFWLQHGTAPAVSCLCLSDDRNFIYSGLVDGTLQTWLIQSGKLVNTMCAHKGAVINALAMGSGTVFSGSSDGTIKVWKRELHCTKRKVKHSLKRLYFPKVAVNAVMYGIEGSSMGLLYAGSSDGLVRCWRKSDNYRPEVMRYHQRAVSCLALTSGRLVFSGSTDRTICVWQRDNKTVSHTIAMVLKGHSSPVRCLAVHEDWEFDSPVAGSRWVLYSSALDRTFKIWRVSEKPPELRRRFSY
ncbi:Transducin/WD40 repeat-like superfamily protein [Rhynchospora pubera]|uniref:Transducin/WD40 repeat-like superfamily protein n=1 Tax=Rhynchospora pubera TaxID=906938 RepID=A0AAV8BZU8_9POAL|nr:Transducin/WD40 repeat-like superfamily protein [Rhynchospora pubera]